MKLAKSKLTKALGMGGLMALAVMASPLASADDTGWYLGANVGQSGAVIDDAKITSNLLGGGFSGVTISDDDRSTGYKIFGGYQYNKYLAVEAGYFDLGKFGFTANASSPGTLGTLNTGTLTGELKVKGLNLDLVGTMPLTDKFSVFGRAGVTYAQTDDAFTGTGSVHVFNPNPSTKDTNYKFGVGMQYAFTPALAMRAEVERYRINDAVGNKGDIDLVSLGLIYRFGAKSPTPVPVAYVPPPVVVAQAPAPVYVAPPPPPPPPPAPIVMPRKVSFSADSLFGFDESSVKAGGQQDLDKFAAELRGTQFDVINVTGHTDRIGSHAYNQKLSERRAEAVKGYLVTSAGIAADKIVAKGVDGAEPVTKPGECVGTKATKALIACLQPDRRVEVEVVGTR
ncbi:MAG: outer membrane beta-barrel protein [Gammaproteobacteria bacterium]|uniref:outer membrane beta-barrel protein n=1 Tax=Rhodoferax sp. TaxID=50421 RepID=UPI0017E8A40B|nr:outer membrane beta-barrel protein [Rhodoferax sp.]MBU3899892.1 outer membrane beta-barrel protein [Gammaproteobacteria bacterium]MBA3057850.1 outer membrane beta-barrel protein [Rhodoferax sp.]MBU3996076.1 outer membrane beta-barrel protein [Gammaproteobacteria bacterium]MBU4019158.1 outer membrane beta-barrel protein [Gammaproteobacteria bacterium]MBU4114648.1 outer membrane beta-barrel protein [Gammaproteobacteria bacterium]